MRLLTAICPTGPTGTIGSFDSETSKSYDTSVGPSLLDVHKIYIYGDGHVEILGTTRHQICMHLTVVYKSHSYQLTFYSVQ